MFLLRTTNVVQASSDTSVSIHHLRSSQPHGQHHRRMACLTSASINENPALYVCCLLFHYYSYLSLHISLLRLSIWASRSAGKFPADIAVSKPISPRIWRTVYITAMDTHIFLLLPLARSHMTKARGKTLAHGDKLYLMDDSMGTKENAMPRDLDLLLGHIFDSGDAKKSWRCVCAVVSLSFDNWHCDLFSLAMSSFVQFCAEIQPPSL